MDENLRIEWHCTMKVRYRAKHRQRSAGLRNFPPNRGRLGILVLLLSVHLVQLTSSGHKVHFIETDPLGSLDDLPERVESDEDG